MSKNTREQELKAFNTTNTKPITNSAQNIKVTQNQKIRNGLKYMSLGIRNNRSDGPITSMLQSTDRFKPSIETTLDYLEDDKNPFVETILQLSSLNWLLVSNLLLSKRTREKTIALLTKRPQLLNNVIVPKERLTHTYVADFIKAIAIIFKTKTHNAIKLTSEIKKNRILCQNINAILAKSDLYYPLFLAYIESEDLFHTFNNRKVDDKTLMISFGSEHRNFDRNNYTNPKRYKDFISDFSKIKKGREEKPGKAVFQHHPWIREKFAINSISDFKQIKSLEAFIRFIALEDNFATYSIEIHKQLVSQLNHLNKNQEPEQTRKQLANCLNKNSSERSIFQDGVNKNLDTVIGLPFLLENILARLNKGDKKLQDMLSLSSTARLAQYALRVSLKHDKTLPLLSKILRKKSENIALDKAFNILRGLLLATNITTLENHFQDMITLFIKTFAMHKTEMTVKELSNAITKHTTKEQQKLIAETAKQLIDIEIENGQKAGLNLARVIELYAQLGGNKNLVTTYREQVQNTLDPVPTTEWLLSMITTHDPKNQYRATVANMIYPARTVKFEFEENNKAKVTLVKHNNKSKSLLDPMDIIDAATQAYEYSLDCDLQNPGNLRRLALIHHRLNGHTSNPPLIKSKDDIPQLKMTGQIKRKFIQYYSCKYSNPDNGPRHPKIVTMLFQYQAKQTQYQKSNPKEKRRLSF